MGSRAFCAKTEHRVPFLLFLPVISLGRFLVQETFNRIALAGTGFCPELLTVTAGRYLGRQQRGEVFLPEGGIDPALFEKTLDVPRRIFHAQFMGAGT